MYTSHATHSLTVFAVATVALVYLDAATLIDLTDDTWVRVLGGFSAYLAATLFLSRNKLLDLIPCRLIRVVDGDTVYIDHMGNEFSIRIPHIDAPERSQEFGDQATAFLISFLEGKLLTFQNSNQDGDRGRQLKLLYADGEDVQLAMVANGYAWVDTTYMATPTSYITAFSHARDNRLGLFHNPKAIHPKYYRNQHRATRERAILVDELLKT